MNFSLTDDDVEEIVEKVFEKYDANKNGFIDKNELRKICEDVAKSRGLPEIKDDKFEATLKGMDLNADGKVSKQELSKFIEEIQNMI